MAAKSAIVLDTNFVIEYMSELSKLHEKLSENFNVYITDISINERISQKYLDLKSKYKEIEKFKNEYSSYVTIKLKRTLDERFDAEKQSTIDNYNKEFDDCIIKFTPNDEMLNVVMDRVFKKIAPFLDVKGASDKGFKDTLIWLSILQYFKEINDNIDVIFITNDNVFLNSADTLKEEFALVTGKSIEIKNNNFYKTLLGDEKPVDDIVMRPQNELTIIEKQEMRDRIESTIDAICNIETYDYWGNQQIERTFITNEKFDESYMERFFSSLSKELEAHILNKQINASSILSIDDRIEDINPIPMQALDEVNKLYEDLKCKYTGLIIPFYCAASEIMNRNFVIRNITSTTEEDIPF